MLVLTLDGRFAYRAQGLRKELLEAIERKTNRVVVDLWSASWIATASAPWSPA